MDEYQQSLIDAIEIIVDNMIEDTPYTTSRIGVVKSKKGLECRVEIYGQVENCLLLEHTADKVGVGDVVVVQDLYNDGTQKFVFSKIGGSKID